MVVVPGVFLLQNAVNLLLLFVFYVPMCYRYFFCYQRGNPIGVLSNTVAEWSRVEGALGGSVVVMSSCVRLQSWRLMPEAFKPGKIRHLGSVGNREPSPRLEMQA